MSWSSNPPDPTGATSECHHLGQLLRALRACSLLVLQRRRSPDYLRFYSSAASLESENKEEDCKNEGAGGRGELLGTLLA